MKPVDKQIYGETAYWSEPDWEQAAERIKTALGCPVYNLGGCLEIDLNDVATFARLQNISNICGHTMAIDLDHEPAGGSEYTPTGDYARVLVWKWNCRG